MRADMRLRGRERANPDQSIEVENKVEVFGKGYRRRHGERIERRAEAAPQHAE